MKHIALLALGILAVAPATLVKAQDDAKAVLALPANLREGASVIKWKPDFTYDTVKKGTNNLACYDLSGYPKHPPFMMECTTMANLDRVAQNLKFEAMGDKAKEAMDAAEKDGTRVKPQYGSVWYHFMGADQEHARVHMTIAVPGATTATTGLPEKGGNNSVWIMSAGTTTAHLMTPGE
jgi:hypothetical protein